MLVRITRLHVTVKKTRLELVTRRDIAPQPMAVPLLASDTFLLLLRQRRALIHIPV